MATSSVSIRKANLTDVPVLASMVERYWQFEGVEGFEATRVEATLAQLLHAPTHGAIWVAQADGDDCGYLVAMYSFSIEYGGLCAEIDELWLTPEQRGNGAGRSLLDTAEREFIARGCVHVYLQVGTENEPAFGFYRRLGYRKRIGFTMIHKAL